MWLRPTVQPTVYQPNRNRAGVCVNAGLINIPPPSDVHTLTPPKGPL